jgi:plastocyanin
MVFNQSLNRRISIRMLLVSGLIAPLILFGIFSVSCQPTTPTAGPTPTPAPTSVEVEMSDFAFVPDTITIPVGTSVTWTNQDPSTHTVTSETGLFDSGILAPNASFSHSFTERGTFSYYCTIHPYMKGKVVVE